MHLLLNRVKYNERKKKRKRRKKKKHYVTCTFLPIGFTTTLLTTSTGILKSSCLLFYSQEARILFLTCFNDKQFLASRPFTTRQFHHCYQIWLYGKCHKLLQKAAREKFNLTSKFFTDKYFTVPWHNSKNISLVLGVNVKSKDNSNVFVCVCVCKIIMVCLEKRHFSRDIFFFFSLKTTHFFVPFSATYLSRFNGLFIA